MISSACCGGLAFGQSGKGRGELGIVQFPREAASWYKWLPMTVVVLFSSADVSASDLPARTSDRSSVLLRRQASMSCSLAEAPCFHASVS